MANVYVTDSELSNIANAIRSKIGSKDSMLLSEMPSAIMSIGDGFKKKTGTVTISADTSSLVIDTGLSTVETVVVLKKNISNVNSTVSWVKCTDFNLVCYKSQYTSGVVATSNISVEGGTVTCNKYSNYPVISGDYYWEVYGK